MEDTRKFYVTPILAIVTGFPYLEGVDIYNYIEILKFMTHGKFVDELTAFKEEYENRSSEEFERKRIKYKRRVVRSCKNSLCEQHPKFKTIWRPAMDDPVNFENWANYIVKKYLDDEKYYSVKAFPTYMVSRFSFQYVLSWP